MFHLSLLSVAGDAGLARGATVFPTVRLTPGERPGFSMSRTRQRIPASHRLRSAADFTRLRTEGRAVRGQHCLVVVAECPGEPRKIAFVASRKSVGGAVQRNRARRRMREIVRRLWPLLPGGGRWMMFVANRSILRASHEQLAADIERLIARALANDPAGEAS